jgi:hypothetical protein
VVVNLENQIAETLSSEIAREIDNEILWGMLQGLGWTRVTLPSFRNNRHAVDIVIWLVENCHGNFEKNGSSFIFEDRKDAVIFTLRWMG